MEYSQYLSQLGTLKQPNLIGILKENMAEQLVQKWDKNWIKIWRKTGAKN